MVQPAGLDLDHNFIGRRLRFGQIAQLEFSRRARGDKLDGFHAGILTPETQRGKAATEPTECRHGFLAPTRAERSEDSAASKRVAARSAARRDFQVLTQRLAFISKCGKVPGATTFTEMRNANAISKA